MRKFSSTPSTLQKQQQQLPLFYDNKYLASWQITGMIESRKVMRWTLTEFKEKYSINEISCIPGVLSDSPHRGEMMDLIFKKNSRESHTLEKKDHQI